MNAFHSYPHACDKEVIKNMSALRGLGSCSSVVCLINVPERQNVLPWYYVDKYIGSSVRIVGDEVVEIEE